MPPGWPLTARSPASSPATRARPPRSRCRRSEQIREDPVAGGGEDRFGVELQPRLLRNGIADRHRHAVDLGVDPKALRQVARAERMIAADRHRRLDAGEGTFPVMRE